MLYSHNYSIFILILKISYILKKISVGIETIL